MATEPLHHADPEPRTVPGARGGPERQTRGWHWPGATRLAPRAAPAAAPPAPRTRDSYYTFTCTPIQVAPPLAAATSHPVTTPGPDTAATPTPHNAPPPASHAIPEANPTTEADTAPAPAVTDSAPTHPRPADPTTGAPTNPPRAHNAAAPAAPHAPPPSHAEPPHDASQDGSAPRPTPSDAPTDDAPSPARLIIGTPSHPAPAIPTTEAPLGTVPPAQQPTTFYRGVLVYAADVTDQVEAVERLRVSERRQREAAVTLQRSLLPQKLEQPDDLRVAATYQPGGTEAAVGGDWYDVITLGAGRTALVIGDVMGRGLRAAAVMGQLRTAVRAYARLDLPPHEVLQLLDGLAAEIDASQIATCVYAVHDPNEGRLIYASAGHLPILVRDPDGTVHRAAEPTGPPLGTGGWLHASGSVPLSPGSSAVLYTDGLVERRDRDIDEGVADLERAFAGAAGSPQVMCDRLIRSLGITADHDDDVAVLVLQHPARTGHDAELFHNAALELLGGVEAAPRARAFASGVLASWRFPTELRDLGVLATSELVANSLQHGTPPMRLRLRRTDRRLIIEVTDGDDHLPRRRRAEPVDEAGRGISIIATIASSWGSRRTPDGGKAVWCEFALPRH
ncbi:SpoIIE family protein phosphatase [Streptomyces buecherae]|uniref:ATP-binding SpoIIE family protein phosphatase n=1 Tax=Streptomyces buecherae TaxID=2763006 RepID=UPI003F53F973